MTSGHGVLVCDDQADIREVVRAVVDAVPGLHVLGEATNADECVTKALALGVDVVVLDVRMPGSGIAAASRLRALRPGVRLLVFTASDDAATLAALHAAGVDEVVLKSGGFDALVAALRRAAEPRLAPHPGD